MKRKLKTMENGIVREAESSANRCKTDQQTDRLSELLDELLVRILNLMPTKDAVKTGTLSKRWLNLWTRVENISFKYSCYDNDAKDDQGKKAVPWFSGFDRVLMQCTCPSIKKFELDICYSRYSDVTSDESFKFDEFIGKWVQFAMRKNVETLILDFYSDEYTPLEWFYRSESLVNLELTGVYIEKRTICWNSLKSLSMINMDIHDDLVEIILSGCPLLESLSFDQCTSFNVLNITSPYLKQLQVSFFEPFIVYSEKYGHKLEIRAPWLQELELTGRFGGVGCKLVDVSSLVNVELTYELSLDEHNENVDILSWASKLLESVQHVPNVTLGPWFIQVLSMLKLIRMPSFMFNCKQLTLDSPILEHELPGTILMLQSSPYLEMLVLKLGDSTYFDDFFGDLQRACDIDGDSYLSAEKIDLLHLNKILVIYCTFECSQWKLEGCEGVSFEVELAEYLLRNTCNLEKFILSCQPINYKRFISGTSESTADEAYSCSRCSTNCHLQFVTLFTKKLLLLCMEDDRGSNWEFRRKESSFEFFF